MRLSPSGSPEFNDEGPTRGNQDQLKFKELCPFIFLNERGEIKVIFSPIALGFGTLMKWGLGLKGSFEDP